MLLVKKLGHINITSNDILNPIKKSKKAAGAHRRGS
jgi:hypothetical protein